MIFSCYGCTERTPECHSTCETYAKERAQNEKERHARKNPVDSYVVQSIIRNRDHAAKGRKRHPLKPGCIK